MVDRGTLSGIYGRVKWPGHYTSHVFSWSIDVEHDVVEDTSWEFDVNGDPVAGTGSDGWRTYMEGLRGFSGSFDAYQDEVPADFAPDTQADIELFIDVRTGAAWVGTALCSGLSNETPVDGASTVSIDFQGVFNLNARDSTTTS